jgi:hypothetical protein
LWELNKSGWYKLVKFVRFVGEKKLRKSKICVICGRKFKSGRHAKRKFRDIRAFREKKKLPCETKKIHTLSVYSIPKIPKFKYTIQQPASNPLPIPKIPTHSVYSPTATFTLPSSKKTVKSRAQKYA